ncbi:MAG: hypothetical protein ACUVS2_12485 [Candidatus Flexifilum sp.]
MSLTRRAFLQAIGLSLGIGLANTMLDGITLETIGRHSWAADGLHSPIGRVLRPVPVISSFDRQTVVRTAWEDEIIPIQPASDRDWFVTPDGLIAAEAVHPLNPDYRYPSRIDAVPPYPAEVCAGSAPIYAWCSASAPLMTRIGGGGAAWIVDRLLIGDIAWLAVAAAPGEAIIGWSNARLWRPIPRPSGELMRVDRVVIDQSSHTLTAYRDRKIYLQTTTAQTTSLRPGRYEVNSSAICASEQCQTQAQPFASGLIVPYPIDFGDGKITGAYWHNRFGQDAPGLIPEGLMTVHPYAARLLYAAVSLGTPVIVS